jgi:hypothetical protein
MIRRSIPVAAAVAVLAAPLTASALATGQVTTGPAAQAPTLTMPLLFLLAAVLAGVAVYRLGRAAGPIAGLALVAAVTMAAGLGYADNWVNTIMIGGADCARQTTNSFDPSGPTMMLMSNCPNPIHILDIRLSCSDPPPPSPPCVVGGTLANGEVCVLPGCV